MRRSPLLIDYGLPLACVLLALLYPLTIYRAGPLALPIGLVSVALVLLIVRAPTYGIAAALAAWPFRRIEVSLPEIGSVQPLKYAIPVLAVLLLGYALVARRRRGDTGPRLPGVLIGLWVFIALALASSILAFEPRAAVGELSQLLSIGVLVLAAALLCRGRDDVLVVAGGAVAGLLAAGIQGIQQQLTGDFSSIAFAFDGAEVGRIAGAFGHPNGYAGYLAALIPIAASLAWHRAMPRWLRLLSAAALAAAVPALLWTYTRGAFGGLVLGALVWLVVARPRAALPVFAVFLFGLAVASPTLRDRIEDVNSGDVNLRADLSRAGLDIYDQRPLLGVGLTNFQTAHAGLPSKPRHSSQRRLLHGDEVLTPPHANNMYANVLAELGIAGFVALLALLAAVLLAALRGTRGPDPWVAAVALGLGAGTLTFAAHNVLEYTLLQTAAPLLVIAVVVAMRARAA